MSSVGYATLQVIPSLRGIETKLNQGLSGPMRAAGEKSGAHLTAGLGTSTARSGRSVGSKLASHISLGFAAYGVGSIIKSSVELEASFSKTLKQIAVATGAPKSAIKGLHDEALKMGAQTVFSANEAAGAMLELGKSGIKTRDILGGGLKGTLTLAAAGSLDLGSAATIASNAMNTFGLHGHDMGRIAAALAGGANASTASVESLGLALSQVGPGAKNAGLSLQETVGTLAAFDQAGIKGSDAGTSLKTMLTRLVPTTKKAKDEMQALGLSFVDSKGNIDSITTVAQKLQDKLSGLSQEQRSQALTTIFGSDATRAATVLMNNGTKGIEKFIKATKDQSAAQKMARANMSGTAGALERLRGATETAKLVLGEALAPTVRSLANYLSRTAVPAVSKFIGQMRDGKGAGGEFAHNLGLVFNAAKGIAGRIGDVISALNGLPDWAKKILAGGAIAGFAAKRLGVTAIVKPTLGKAVGGLLGGGVQKVFVVNPGFGKGGVPGVPSSPGGKVPPIVPAAASSSLLAGLGTYLGLAAAPALGAYLLPKLLSGQNESTAKSISVAQQGSAGSGGGMTLPSSFSFDDGNKPLNIFPKGFLGTLTAGVGQLNTMKAVLLGLGQPIGLVRKELGALSKTKTEPKIGADSAPLVGHYRQSKNLLIELGKQHPISTLDANGKPAQSKTQAILHSLGIVDHYKATAQIDVNAAAALQTLARVRNEISAIPPSKTTVLTTIHRGGIQKAAGGYITGPGTGTSDSIPAMLSNGEFVVNARATRRHIDLLRSINAQRFAAGGQVGGSSGGPQTLHFYDADGQLLATMRGIARQEIDDTASFSQTMRGRR